MTDPLLLVEGLTYSYARRGARRAQPALRNVSFALSRGEAFGVVGESGSGKSTLARIVAGLLTPDEGRVTFSGQDLSSCLEKDEKAFRSRVQIVFQDPYASLNPRASIETIIAGPIKAHRYTAAERRTRIHEALDLVGLDRIFLQRRPSGLSGGQRQRVAIARALALQPELLILDEPTSALDVSSQAHLINLLTRLREELGLSYLMISHDLSLIAYFCDQTLVLKDGECVEAGNAQETYYRPRHNYTQQLMAAVNLSASLGQGTPRR